MSAGWRADLPREVVEYFQGKRKLENALKQKIAFESAISKAVDFGRVKGHAQAKEAALISAAEGTTC